MGMEFIRAFDIVRFNLPVRIFHSSRNFIIVIKKKCAVGSYPEPEECNPRSSVLLP
jgi:hypothetical protein